MSEARKRPYYVCFVPKCTNTTIKTKDKLFITMPSDKKARKLWWAAARRDEPLKNHAYYCCEDHFDVSINTTCIFMLDNKTFSEL